MINFLSLLSLLICLGGCHGVHQSTTYSEETMAVPIENEVSDTARLVIHTGEIELVVDHVESAFEELRHFVNSIDGHTFHYEINHKIQESREVQCNKDSMLTIHKIQPNAFLKVKIPIEQTDSFIHMILSMNADLSHFMLDEEDITENQLEKTALTNFYLGAQSKTAKKSTLQEIKYGDEKISKGLAIKKALDQLNYKSKYLWFDIQLRGSVYYKEQKHFFLATTHTPFYLSAHMAFQKGWFLFQQCMISCIRLWPLLFLFVLLIFLFRTKKFIRWMQKQKSK